MTRDRTGGRELLRRDWRRDLHRLELAGVFRFPRVDGRSPQINGRGAAGLMPAAPADCGSLEKRKDTKNSHWWTRDLYNRDFDRSSFAVHKEKEMADFRRWILAFATLVLVSGLVGPASAQPGAQLLCTATAWVIPTLRHEGFTELTGDIVLTCVGAPGSVPTPVGENIPQTTVSVSLSAPVTSRILGGVSPQLLTDALLLVDDPSPANQDPCLSPTNPAACVVPGDGGQTFNEPGKFNVFQGLGGTVAGPNSVTFLGVPVDPPAVGSRTYRITNIRIDATSVAVGSDGLAPVYAFVSSTSSGSGSILIGNPQQLYVGFAAFGETATTSSANPIFYQCDTAAQTTTSTVTFIENFATAFKVQTDGVQNLPGVIYFSESGLQIAVTDGTSGTANTATELQTVISNIPVGAAVSVDGYAPSTAQYLCPQDAPPGCVSVPSDANLLLPVPNPTPGLPAIVQVADNSNGTGPISVTVVWGITNTNPSAIDSLAFNVYTSFTGQGGNTTAVTGSATALSGFSPQVAVSSSSESIPSFSSIVETSTSPANLFTLSQCQPPISPAPGITFSGSLVDFSWSAVSDATEYQLTVGTNPGGNNVFSGTTAGTSETVRYIPCTDAGAIIYVQLAAEVGGSFQPAADYTYKCKSGLGDFNGDGYQDLVWMNNSTQQVTVHYFDGTQGATDIGWNWLNEAGEPGGWVLVGAADFDGNGVPDLVWEYMPTGQVTVNYYGGPGGATYQGWNWLNETGAPGWTVVAVADMNNDGAPDLIWQNNTTNQVTVNYYGGTGGAVYQRWNWLNSGGEPAGWRVVGAADFDGNGTPDLVWQYAPTRQVSVNYYGGAGGATYQGWNWLNEAGVPGWTVVGASDFNGDGVPDLVWQNDATAQVTVNYYGGTGGATYIGWNWLASSGFPGWTAVVPR